jgi:hypothetical protein
MSPLCPRCHARVPVSRSTFLMVDNSRPMAKRPDGAKQA